MKKLIIASLSIPVLTLAFVSCEKAPDAAADLDTTQPVERVKTSEPADPEKEKRDRARKEKLKATMAKLRQQDEPRTSSRDITATSGSHQYWLAIEQKLVARGSAVGRRLGDITTNARETFEEAVVKDADSIGINITHKNGVKRIHYEDLSAQLQLMFRYDPEEAAQAAKGVSLPILPTERQSRVAKLIQIQIQESHIAASQAHVAAKDAKRSQSEAVRAEKDKQEKLLDRKLDAAYTARNGALRKIALNERRLKELVAAAKEARYGRPNARIKKSGADTAATREADEKVERQRALIEASESELLKKEASIDKYTSDLEDL